MSMPINILSDCENSYKSRIDYNSIRTRFAKPYRYRIHLSYNKLDMPYEILKKLLNETLWTKPIYTFLGNDSLAYPKFTELLDFLGSESASIEVVTDGMLIDKYIHLFKKYNVSAIVMIETGVSEIEGLKSALDNLRAEDIKLLNCNFVILSPELSKAEELLKFLQDYPFNSISFQCENESIPDTALNNIKNNVEKYYSNSGTSVCFSHVFYEDGFDNKNNVCLKPWLNPTIMPNGDILSCISNKIGNLNSDSIWEVWNGENNQQLRIKLLNQQLSNICPNCEDLYYQYPIEIERK